LWNLPSQPDGESRLLVIQAIFRAQERDNTPRVVTRGKERERELHVVHMFPIDRWDRAMQP
jgi:hypothetical protein